MCDKHDPAISMPEDQGCLTQDNLGMDLADFITLAQNDRETALQVFMKDVPPAYRDETNRPLLEQAFDGYVVFLNERQAKQEKQHVHG